MPAHLRFLFFCLSLVSAVHGQEFVWGYSFGAQGNALTALATDRLGNAYAAGNCKPPLQVGPGTVPASAGIAGLFLMKSKGGPAYFPVPKSGTEWIAFLSCRSGATAASLAADSSGFLYLAGSFEDSLRAGNLTLRGDAGWNGFLAKFDSHGEPIWLRRVAAGDRYWRMGAVRLDAQGRPVLIGTYIGQTDINGKNSDSLRVGDTTYHWGANLLPFGYGAFLASFDTAGAFRWATTIHFTSSFQSQADQGLPPAMDIGPDGDIILAGQFSNSLPSRFDNVEFPGGGKGVRLFTAAFTGEGRLQWINLLGETHDWANLNAVKVTPSGAYILGGYFNRPLQLADTLLSPRVDSSTSSGSGADMFLASVDRSGKATWVRATGSNYWDQIDDLALDAAGRIYTIGRGSNIPGFTDFSGPGPEKDGKPDLYGAFGHLARYSPDGALDWVRWSDAPVAGRYFFAATDTAVYLGFTDLSDARTIRMGGKQIDKVGGDLNVLARFSPQKIPVATGMIRPGMRKSPGGRESIARGRGRFFLPPSAWIDGMGRKLLPPGATRE